VKGREIGLELKETKNRREGEEDGMMMITNESSNKYNQNQKQKKKRGSKRGKKGGSWVV